MSEIDDDLIDPNYNNGDPNREYDGEPDARQTLNEAYLGNDETLTRFLETSATYGKESFTFGELIEAGFDYWMYQYESYMLPESTMERLRSRLNEKIAKRYAWRELSITPIKRWTDLFTSHLEDQINQYAPVYIEIEKGLNILDDGLREYVKTEVDSNYPQARIRNSKQEQRDYASESTEVQEREVKPLGQIKGITQYSSYYNEPDKMILDSLYGFFTTII